MKVSALLLALLPASSAWAQLGPAPGRFLIAAEHVADPNFFETVVLLIRYDPDGALGLIVNRPTAIPLAEVLSDDAVPLKVDGSVYIGGPVEQHGLMLLIRSEDDIEDAERVFADVHHTAAMSALETAVAEKLTLRGYVGYSGWGAGQLDAEFDRNDWRVAPAAAEMVFDPKPETLWRRLMDRANIRIARAARAAWSPFRPTASSRRFHARR